MDYRLDAIVNYEMDELQALAYKLCLIWLKKSHEVFPNYNHAKFTKGDPRKSLIFKYCYKCVRDNQGLLDEIDFPLYVTAQLETLKAIEDGDEHPLIDASCLCGPRAWRRWKMWGRKYENQTKFVDQAPLKASTNKVILALEKTKEFLVQTFNGEPTIQKMQEAVINKNLYRWITVGKVSPFYLVISPYIAQVLPGENLQNAINFDLGIYRDSITPEIRTYFEEKFPQEKAIQT